MMDEFGDPVVGLRERLLSLAVDTIMRAASPGDVFNAAVLAKNVAAVHEALLARMLIPPRDA